MAEYDEATTAQSASATTPEEDKPVKTPREWAEYWSKEVSTAKNWMRRFHTQGKRIESIYLSETEVQNNEIESDQYNIFWSNVQTIMAIVYGRLPQTSVDRANLDANDDVARVAALILERIFNIELKNSDESPQFVYGEAIRDLFIAGLGLAWARYDFTSRTVTIPAVMDEESQTELAPEVNFQIVSDEFAPLDYVRWSDFLISPCKRWEDARWVGRRVCMGVEAAKKRFGEEKTSQIPRLSKQSNRYSGPDDPLRHMAHETVDIWELWDKESKTVSWYAEGMDEILQNVFDPLRLHSFFPVKKPLRATTVTSTFIPRADYVYLSDQYDELNMISTRLRMLSQALKVTGVYDKTAGPVHRILNQATNNELIPVDNWAMFAEKGGIKGVVDWFPLEAVAATLDKLTQRKIEVIKDVYEIYGINDVMRGTTHASETATAQRLKSQFGSARVEVRQNQIAEWVTANMRMRAEIICNHWQPETIIQRSQIMQTPDGQLAQPAVQLLKSKPQEIITRLAISADTISSPDWQMEKQQRTEFLQAVAQFIGMCMPLVQSMPNSTVFLIQLLQWGAMGFKAGKQIEGVLDQALISVQQSLQTPKPPPPPTAQDRKDEGAAQESLADAKKKAVETMLALQQMNFPPQMYPMIPPQQLPGAPPGAVPPPMGQQPPPGGAPGQQPGIPGPGGPPPPMPGPRNVPGPGGPPPYMAGPNPGGQPV